MKKKWFAVSDEPVQKRKKIMEIIFSYKYNIIMVLRLTLVKFAMYSIPIVMKNDRVKIRATMSIGKSYLKAQHNWSDI